MKSLLATMQTEKARWATAYLGSLILLTWPSVWNGFPLLFFGDSISYLGSGMPAARALFLGSFSGFYGDRSVLYGLSILPFHWNVTAWPVVVLQAAATSFVLLRVTRALLPDCSPQRFFLAIAALCLLTSLPWFVSFIMPDVLGAMLYLALYLFAFCSETLSRAQRVILGVIAVWAATSHATHFLVAGGLVVLIASVVAWQGRSFSRSLPVFRWLGGILLIAAAVQISLHAYLFGAPTLFNRYYPFVLARVVTDAPGRAYLEQRCATSDFAICKHVAELPRSSGAFLWDENGIWQSSPPEERRRLLDEETRVVTGVLRASPWGVLGASARHFVHQSVSFGLRDFAKGSQALADRIDTALAGSRDVYLESRQSRGTLHVRFFTLLQRLTVGLSLVVVGVCALRPRFWASPRLVALTAVVAYVLIANAAITGALSAVAPRYQGRVIWLLPMLAVLLVLARISPASYPLRRDTRA